MKITSSNAGHITVEHEDGYVFTFQIHYLDEPVMDLADVRWASVGPPPDADALELAARGLAEREAKEQGWL